MDIYTTTIVTSILVYVVIGNYAGRGVKHLDDYYVAGRRAPTLVIAGTLVASVLSSTIFLGGAGFAYELKEHVRSRYQKQIPNYIHDVILHAADNYDVHTRHLDGLLAKAGLRQAKTGLTNVCQCANQTQQQQLIPPARADAPDASPVVDTRSAGGPRQVEQQRQARTELVPSKREEGGQQQRHAAVSLSGSSFRMHELPYRVKGSMTCISSMEVFRSTTPDF